MPTNLNAQVTPEPIQEFTDKAIVGVILGRFIS